MKRNFKLYIPHADGDRDSGFQISIIGQEPKNKPYVSIDFGSHQSVNVIADKDLEMLGVNILKAIKSKKLRQ